jgi:CBS domain-containing protein
MTRGLVWVSPDVSAAAAAEMMVRSGLHHLPVLDALQVPIGMLSAMDLAGWMAAPSR